MLLRKIIRLLEDFDSFCRSIEPWDIELKPSTWRDMFALSCWLMLVVFYIGTNWIDLKTRQLPGAQLMLGKLGMCIWLENGDLTSPAPGARARGCFRSGDFLRKSWKTQLGSPKDWGFTGTRWCQLQQASTSEDMPFNDYIILWIWITISEIILIYINASAAFALFFFEKNHMWWALDLFVCPPGETCHNCGRTLTEAGWCDLHACIHTVEPEK